MTRSHVTATPGHLRLLNERTLVRLLLRLGTASRADLAKAAGMSQPTAGKIAQHLVDLGVLQEVESDSPSAAGGNGTDRALRPGRPGRMLRLDTTQPRFVAIQLDADRTSLALLPIAVPAVERWERQFTTPGNPKAWLGALNRAAADLPRSPLWAALLSVPGVVDEATGKVLFSPNLHWTEGFDLIGAVQSVWPLSVMPVQEIRALALGHQATQPDSDDFLLVDFGLGVGGAVVLGGKLFHGSLPLSGELGHSPVPGNARRCGCGAVGCVETLLSRPGLIQSFAAAEHATNANWSSLAAHVATHGVRPWLADSLGAAGRVIAGSLNTLGLRRVVLTGSLTELAPAVSDRLADSIRSAAMWARFGDVLCETAPRRRMAGLVAAAIDRLVVPASFWEAGARHQPRQSFLRQKRRPPTARRSSHWRKRMALKPRTDLK